MKDDRLYLIHIRECIRRIESYTSGGRESFMASTIQQDAVIRNLEIIGEAVKKISGHTLASHPEIPWRRVAGLRDLLIHRYMGVDLEEVWSIVIQDIPPLKGVIVLMCEGKNDTH